MELRVLLDNADANKLSRILYGDFRAPEKAAVAVIYEAFCNTLQYMPIMAVQIVTPYSEVSYSTVAELEDGNNQTILNKDPDRGELL